MKKFEKKKFKFYLYGMTQNKNSITQNKNSITQNKNSITQNKNSITQNKNSIKNLNATQIKLKLFFQSFSEQ